MRSGRQQLSGCGVPARTVRPASGFGRGLRAVDRSFGRGEDQEFEAADLPFETSQGDDGAYSSLLYQCRGVAREGFAGPGRFGKRPRETGAGIGRVPGDGRCGTRCLLQEERSGDECRRPARSGRIFPERGSRSVRNRAADSRYVLERPLPSYDLHDRAGEHYGRGVVRERRDRRHAGALPENPPRTGARGQEHLPDGPGDDRCPLPAQQGTARRPGGERGEQRMQRFRRCGRR